MIKTIDINKARDNFDELMDEVSSGENQYVVKDNGKRQIALMSLDDFNNYQSMIRSKEETRIEVIEMLKEIWEFNKDIPPEEIERDIAKAVAAVKKQELDELKMNQVI